MDGAHEQTDPIAHVDLFVQDGATDRLWEQPARDEGSDTHPPLEIRALGACAQGDKRKVKHDCRKV